MNDRTRPALPLAAALALCVTPASATVTFGGGFSGSAAEVNSAIQFTYAGDVSSTDLINGLTPTISGWNTTNNAHPNELTDGIHGAAFDVVPGDKVQGAWTTVGANAEYALGAGANGLGYDISSVQSIADWVNVGFGNQVWTLEVKPLGGSYATLATVDFQALGAGVGTTKVTLSGLDASGIEFIKVTTGSQGGHASGAFVWRELDVFGTDTVPEPSAAALLGLGGLALLRQRRRD